MMQRVLNTDIVEHQQPGQVYLAGSELWSRVPDFEYVSPSTGWVLQRQMPAIVILLGWLLLGTVGAFYSVTRAQVV
jgi:hypothetical protein